MEDKWENIPLEDYNSNDQDHIIPMWFEVNGNIFPFDAQLLLEHIGYEINQSS